MADTAAPQTGYAPVNSLEMYYEIHGAGRPLVLLHGAFSAIGTSFGKLLPSLAESRQVIAFELQAHGRTADIDRPVLRRAHEPGARVVRDTRLGPLLERGDERVLRQVLRQADVVHPGAARSGASIR